MPLRITYPCTKRYDPEQTRIKRKIVLGDSDNDDMKKAASSAKPSSDVDGASPPPRRGMFYNHALCAT